MSESQERMCAVVEPAKLDAFLEICAKWDVARDRHRRGRRQRPADRASGTARRSSTCRRAPSPTRARSTSGRSPGPSWQDALQADGPVDAAAPGVRRRAARHAAADGRPRPTSRRSRGSPTSTTATCSATPCSRSPRTPAWSASTRRPASASRSRPTATAGSPSSTRTPARSSRCPRPTATSPSAGATPLAVTDCLNFGSPEDPDVMWQFAEATRGLADACLELGVPVTGGNVSFYNQTGDVAINPTPVVGVLGVIDDVRRRVADGLRRARARRVLLLGETRDELGGSEWAHHVHGHLGGLPPRVDLAAEQALGAADGRGCRGGAGDRGARRVRRRAGADAGRDGAAPRRRRDASTVDGDPFVALFSESVARAVVAVPADRRRGAARPRRGVRRAGRPGWARTGGDSLVVEGMPSDRRRRAARRPRGHPPRPVRLTSVPLVCDLSPRHAGVGTACRVTQVANDHR